MSSRLRAITFLLVCGCTTPKTTSKPPEDAEPPPAPAVVSPLDEAMQDHWALTAWTRDAVIAGELEAAEKGARILATEEPNAAVPDWTPFVDEMKANAARVADANSLDEAAAAIGDLGATCGRCHVDTGAVLQFEQDGPPPSSSDIDAHMARHAWASQQMWKGLVGPSDEAWISGAESLRDRPLHDNEFFDRWTMTPEITGLGTRVHDIGIEAQDAPASERANLYGGLISTCASCHVSLVRR